MADNQQPVIELNLNGQDTEIKRQEEESAAQAAAETDSSRMPGVTMLLDRKKFKASKQSANNTAPQLGLETPPTLDEMASDILPTRSQDMRSAPPEVSSDLDASAPAIIASPRRRGTKIIVAAPQPGAGEPPPFSGIIFATKVDFKAFQKAIGKHRKSSDMKKLDCLGYFSTRFTEIVYFEVNEQGSLAGVLGWGNEQLVSAARSHHVTPEVLPSIFEVLSQGEIFVGPIESLRGEDQSGFSRLGFTCASFVGAFPMQYKKTVTGLWLCAGSSQQEISQKELKALKKFLSDFSL